MVKAFAASTLAVIVLFGGGLAAVACSGSSESTFAPEPPKPDAEEDGSLPSIIPADGGAGDGNAETGPPVSCTPAKPASFTPAWTAPIKKTACTAPQLKAYYDACLADPSTTEGNGACAKFKTDAATTDCGTCAEPADGTGPVQWHLARKYFTLNVGGCLALNQDAPPPGTCGQSLNAAQDCSREACEGCFAIGGSFDQFIKCQMAVKGSGACTSYDVAYASACMGFVDAGPGTRACFKGSTEDPEVYRTRVVGLLCGP